MKLKGINDSKAEVTADEKAGSHRKGSILWRWVGWMLAPAVLIAYVAYSRENCGKLLVSSNLDSDHDHLRIDYGFGSVNIGRFELDRSPPRIRVCRRGLSDIEVNPLEHPSTVELDRTGELAISWDGEPRFIVCRLRGFHMMKVIAMLHTWPKESLHQLRVFESGAYGK